MFPLWFADGWVLCRVFQVLFEIKLSHICVLGLRFDTHFMSQHCRTLIGQSLGWVCFGVVWFDVVWCGVVWFHWGFFLPGKPFPVLKHD